MTQILAKQVEAVNPVANALQALLKQSYAVFLLTHNYHWNVEGPKFVSLHTLFEQQYTELFAAIDELAERIRALDAYALPQHYDAILQSVHAMTNPLQTESKADVAANLMVQNLIKLNEELVQAARQAKEAAAKAGDDESEDMAIGRIAVHQKTIWMLKSIIK